MSSDVQPVRHQTPMPRVIPRPAVTGSQSAEAAARPVDAERAAQVARVRERLESGALDQVAVYRATARQILARQLAGDL
jgi:hypothetical protein